jgi:hypothetical protein
MLMPSVTVRWIGSGESSDENEKFVISIQYVTPSAEARARADEIIAAFDEWRAAKDTRPRGYKTAKRRYEKAERIESRLERNIHSISATTVEGMIAKARCAELYYFEGGIHGDFSESIAHDLLALR